MMKKLKFLFAAFALPALVLTSCNNDEGEEEPNYSYVIDFEAARIASQSGTYTNILWGLEEAVDVDGTLIFDDIVYKEDGANFGSYYFNGAWESWGGFAVSTNRFLDEPASDYDLTNQFAVYANTNSKFGMIYDSSWSESTEIYSVPTIEFDEPQTLISADFANSNKAYYHCKNNATITLAGTDTEEKIYFKAIVQGYNGESVAGKVEFYLAKDGEILSNWKEISLTALGEVDRVVFSFESNHSNEYGPLVPLYLCVDNIKVK